MRYAAATFGGTGLILATPSAGDVSMAVEAAAAIGVDCAGATARFAGASFICSTL